MIIGDKLINYFERDFGGVLMHIMYSLSFVLSVILSLLSGFSRYIYTHTRMDQMYGIIIIFCVQLFFFFSGADC